MKKYLTLTSRIFQINLIREMEFKENFFLWFLIQIIWVGLQIFVIQILFSYTDNLLGWTKPQVFLLTGMFRVLRGVFDFLNFANLIGLSDSINKGELDYQLTKPVSSLYFLTFRRHEYSEVGTVLTGLGFIAYALSQLPQLFTVGVVAQIIFFVLAGYLAFYCLILLFSTIAFFTNRLDSTSSYYDIANTFLRYPTDIYGPPGAVSYLLLPLAMVVTIPSKIIFQKLSWDWTLLEIILVVVLCVLSYRFWLFALKHYSSASS